MAILWQKRLGGTRYEVRKAGRTLRLYTNGVCHSEFNPNKIVTGSIWDLLLLPAFFYPIGQVKRILVMGIGGGAVIQQLLALFEPEQIIGVDYDPVHLYVARRFFGVKHPDVELYEADAVAWIRQYDGPAFDMIIEDLFIEEKGEPVRAVTAENTWFNTLYRHMTRDGVLVMNFVSNNELKQSAYYTDNNIREIFKAAFRLRAPLLDNAVGAFLKINMESSGLRKNIMLVPRLNQAIQSKKLRYRITKLDIK